MNDWVIIVVIGSAGALHLKLEHVPEKLNGLVLGAFPMEPKWVIIGPVSSHDSPGE
jgi:hypothetical protein